MLKLPAITDPCICCPEGVPCQGETKCPVYQNYEVRLKSRNETLKAVYKWLEGQIVKRQIRRTVTLYGPELDEIKKISEVK